MQRFLGREDNADAYARLDADVVRVLEDLIEVLLAHGLLRITDLPQPAQAKFFARREHRERQPAPAAFAASGFVDIIDDSAFASLGAAERPASG
ncbi:MAG: hypothetical protein QM722_04895 [Piscinibacter sp.]